MAPDSGSVMEAYPVSPSSQWHTGNYIIIILSFLAETLFTAMTIIFFALQYLWYSVQMFACAC